MSAEIQTPSWLEEKTLEPFHPVGAGRNRQRAQNNHTNDHALNLESPSHPQITPLFFLFLPGPAESMDWSRQVRGLKFRQFSLKVL